LSQYSLLRTVHNGEHEQYATSRPTLFEGPFKFDPIAQRLRSKHPPQFHLLYTDKMQQKTPDEVAAILKQWRKLKDRYHEKAAEQEDLNAECDRLCKTIRSHQRKYAARLKKFAPSIDLDRLSIGELNLRSQAMEYDKKAGEATWALYKTQKKLRDIYQALEELQTFHIEHLVMDKAGEATVQKAHSTIAAYSDYLRDLGPYVVEEREVIMSRINRPE
jgi:hypothetical protein